MAGRHGHSCKIIAVLFIILLSGSECARIHSQVRARKQGHGERTRVSGTQKVSLKFSSREHLDNQRLFSGDAATGVFWHNDVCRSGDMQIADGGAAVKRYEEKFSKVVTLAAKLRDVKCSKKTCALKWLELKSRMVHFNSCAALVTQENSENVPKRLLDTLAAEQTALTRVFAESLSTVSSALRRSDLFPARDKCKFDPAQLNHVISIAREQGDYESARDITRAQLYGQECDEAAAQEYLSSLKGLPKRTAKAIMKMVDGLLDLAYKGSTTLEEETVTEQLTSAVAEAKAIAADTDVNSDEQLLARRLEQEVEKIETAEDDEYVSSASLLETFDGNLDGDLPETAGEWFHFIMANALMAILLIGLVALTLFLLFTTNFAAVGAAAGAAGAAR